MYFKVDKNFFDKVDDACFGILIVENFDNNKDYPKIKKMLKENIIIKYNELKETNIKENISILPYRQAFQKLNINPNKYKCSIEALISRIAKGNDLPNINPIVDLGNALSIKYLLPIGIHDIDRFVNGIELREANELDKFIPFNSNEIETPDIGEIIYVSNNDVKTRRWTWRQGENSKITNTSKNLFIPIDGFLCNKENIIKLQNELYDILTNKYNLNVKKGFIDINNTIFEF